MQRIGDIIYEKIFKKKAFLSKSTKKAFMTWALEAHKLDPSRTVSQYYKFYVFQLRKKYQEKKNKEDFYENEVIEV